MKPCCDNNLTAALLYTHSVLFLQRMKGLSYILSFYLLLLSVFPCCMTDGCPDDKIQKEQAANHDNGDEDCGNCSPFFNCAGCTSVMATVEQVYSNNISLTLKLVYARFLSPCIPNVHYDFWQPPKLA